MEPNIKEVAGRIRALREDLDITMQEMADATGRSVAEYAAQESGEQDLSFTFLYKCAQRLGVDVIELLTGEDPPPFPATRSRGRPTGFPSSGAPGSSTCTRPPHFKNKLAEPFLVTAPYLEEEQDRPIHLSHHKGQELDFVISGRMRFAYEDHVEELEAGRSAHVRLGPRPRHDSHRRRAVRVFGRRHESRTGRLSRRCRLRARSLRRMRAFGSAVFETILSVWRRDAAACLERRPIQ